MPERYPSWRCRFARYCVLFLFENNKKQRHFCITKWYTITLMLQKCITLIGCSTRGYKLEERFGKWGKISWRKPVSGRTSFQNWHAKQKLKQKKKMSFGYKTYPYTSSYITCFLIYNYLCNQCLSPLMLWVRITIGARCTMSCEKVISDLRQVGCFLRVLRQ